MSKIGNLMIDLQDEIERGELTFRQIAAKYEVPLSWVDEAAAELAEQYNDEMDGDAASALASCGWGVDEDYVVENDYFDDF